VDLLVGGGSADDVVRKLSEGDMCNSLHRHGVGSCRTLHYVCDNAPEPAYRTRPVSFCDAADNSHSR